MSLDVPDDIKAQLDVDYDVLDDVEIYDADLDVRDDEDVLLDVDVLGLGLNAYKPINLLEDPRDSKKHDALAKSANNEVPGYNVQHKMRPTNADTQRLKEILRQHVPEKTNKPGQKSRPLKRLVRRSFSWISYIKDSTSIFQTKILSALHHALHHVAVQRILMKSSKDCNSAKDMYYRDCLQFLIQEMCTQFESDGMVTSAKGLWTPCKWKANGSIPSHKADPHVEFTRSFMKLHLLEFEDVADGTQRGMVEGHDSKKHGTLQEFDSCNYRLVIVELKWTSRFGPRTTFCIARTLRQQNSKKILGLLMLQISRDQIQEISNPGVLCEIRASESLAASASSFQREFIALRIATANCGKQKLSPYLDHVILSGLHNVDYSPADKQQYHSSAGAEFKTNWLPLDASQQKAINCCLDAKPGQVVLVRGPPGTGKSHTICGIIVGHATKLFQRMLDEVKRALPIMMSAIRQPDEKVVHKNILYNLAHKFGEIIARQRILLTAPTNVAVSAILTKVHDAILLFSERQSEGFLDKEFVVQLSSVARRQQHQTNHSDSPVALYSLEKKCVWDHAKWNSSEVATSTIGELAEIIQTEDSALNVECSILRLVKQLWLHLRSKSIHSLSCTMERERKIVASSFLIIATLNSFGHRSIAPGCDSETLLNHTFDIAIVDEAAQATELATLVPLCLPWKRLVLVGDDKQLPPTVRSQQCKNKGKKKQANSLFENLWNTRPLVVDSNTMANAKFTVISRCHLEFQYRMHPQIAEFSRDNFYDGALTTPPSIGWARQNCIFTQFRRCNACMFVNVKGKECQNSSIVETEHINYSIRTCNTSYGNLVEAQHVSWLAHYLMIECYPNSREGITKAKNDCHSQHNPIAIITFYRLQKQFVKSQLQKLASVVELTGETDWVKIIASKLRRVQVDTVDSFQGSESDIIILSCVRSNNYENISQSIGFLMDLRRLNVAITRARISLIIMGCRNTLERHKYWGRLLSYCDHIARLCPLSRKRIDSDSLYKFATIVKSNVKRTSIQTRKVKNDSSLSILPNGSEKCKKSQKITVKMEQSVQSHTKKTIIKSTKRTSDKRKFNAMVLSSTSSKNEKNRDDRLSDDNVTALNGSHPISSSTVTLFQKNKQKGNSAYTIKGIITDTLADSDIIYPIRYISHKGLRRQANGLRRQANGQVTKSQCQRKRSPIHSSIKGAAKMQKRERCRFFQRGCCRNKNCRFLHDRNDRIIRKIHRPSLQSLHSTVTTMKSRVSMKSTNGKSNSKETHIPNKRNRKLPTDEEGNCTHEFCTRNYFAKHKPGAIPGCGLICKLTQKGTKCSTPDDESQTLFGHFFTANCHKCLHNSKDIPKEIKESTQSSNLHPTNS